MPAIKPTTKRFNNALKSAGMSLAFVAKAIGRSEGTIRNVLNGNAPTESRETKQRITDFFGWPMFPGIKPAPAFVRIMLPAGSKLVLPKAEHALCVAEYFSPTTVIEGGTLLFTQPVGLFRPKPRRSSQRTSQPTHTPNP